MLPISMKPTASDAFGETAPWQSMLERHNELFVTMVNGSRIGIVQREVSGILPGKRLNGIEITSEFPMLTWVIENDVMSARIDQISNIPSTNVDLLLVADTEGLASMLANLNGDLLKTIKRLIRCGSMMIFVFKNKAQLQEAGYEDFLDSLGLAFLGACR